MFVTIVGVLDAYKKKKRDSWCVSLGGSVFIAVLSFVRSVSDNSILWFPDQQTKKKRTEKICPHIKLSTKNMSAAQAIEKIMSAHQYFRKKYIRSTSHRRFPPCSKRHATSLPTSRLHRETCIRRTTTKKLPVGDERGTKKSKNIMKK